VSLNILIAPSGFKESLSSEEVANCMEEGILLALPDANVTKAPVVDGGEGFTRTLVKFTGGTLHSAKVLGPVGQEIEAHYGFLGGEGPRTAVLEIASAAGLRLVPRDARDPLRTTTYGVGQLIKAALDAGAQRLLIGSGDSGTSDGGAGMVQALGIRLFDGAGREIGYGGGELLRLERIDISHQHPRIAEVQIDVACNFNHVLCGHQGAARVFAPQKGASPATVEQLVAALDHYADVIERELGVDVRATPGGGGSGGSVAGLHVFLNAALHPCYKINLDYLGIKDAIRDANLVVTGEGSLDWQTPEGKIPAEIARLAKSHNLPVIAISGMIGKDAQQNYLHGIDSISSVMESPTTLPEAINHAPELLTRATERVMRTVLVGKRLYENSESEKVQSLHRGLEHVDPSATGGDALPLAFLGALSEELRTPLNLVIAYSKMMKDKMLGTISPEQEKALQQVIKSAYWVLMMMNGLLQSSGVPDKAVPMPVADVLVSQVMPEAPTNGTH
jgi:glycerate kinase